MVMGTAPQCHLSLVTMITLMFLCVSIITLETKPVVAAADLPGVLYTSGRWIVNEDGERVKLACLNWPSHLDAMVAEGLSHQPLDVISKVIKTKGFNCVRLTWPLSLLTGNHSQLTVRESFQNLGLLRLISRIQANNPSIIDLPLVEALQAVVKSLGDNGVMVILDNHITQPIWCCYYMDGNGFFGDPYFDPDLWIMGLTKMATIFNGVTNVVGMSLRNELRGPKQNVPDWYRYMPKGAEAVHAANPNVLVIMSGLSFDTDLSFVEKQPVQLSFNNKLVFEAHWYSIGDAQAWTTGNQNQVCRQVTEKVMRMWGFILQQGRGWPLFLSEFGVDMRGTYANDNKFFNCFMALAAELDFHWALWSLAGSYYTVQGVVGKEAHHSLLNANWTQVRNPSFLQRISGIQLPFQGTEAQPNKVIFHPLTGLCVLKMSQQVEDLLSLGPCSNSDGWEYTAQNILSIKGTDFCLQADGEGKQAKLGKACSSPNSAWKMISDSKMHLSYKLNNGSSTVCLDVGTDNKTIVTNACKCLSNDNTCDPASQWFKLVDSTSTRKLIT